MLNRRRLLAPTTTAVGLLVLFCLASPRAWAHEPTPPGSETSERPWHRVLIQVQGGLSFPLGYSVGGAVDVRLLHGLHLGGQFLAMGPDKDHAFMVGALRASYRFRAGPMQFAALVGLGHVAALRYSTERWTVSEQWPVSPLLGLQAAVHLSRFLIGMEFVTAPVGIRETSSYGAEQEDTLYPFSLTICLGISL